MTSRELVNQVALVTGASSGLGVDFSRQLAIRGANLILVARREDQLRSVAAEIEKTYAVSAQAIALDLATPAAPQTLYDQLQQQGIHVDVLVNNAGFGIYGDFAAVPWEHEKAMLDLDIVTLTHMTKVFVQDMLKRKHGYILQVASIGAYQPSPTYATYSAAKAYVLSMGEAINYELRGSGVSVTVISPGVTATEFLKVAGQSPSFYQPHDDGQRYRGAYRHRAYAAPAVQCGSRFHEQPVGFRHALDATSDAGGCRALIDDKQLTRVARIRVSASAPADRSEGIHRPSLLYD